MGSLSDELAGKVTELVDRALALVPRHRKVDWARTQAAVWVHRSWVGALRPAPDIDDIALDDLLEIDHQKSAIVANTEQFCRELPANNVLLWGARGTGKSSLIHALLNSFSSKGLRLVEVDKRALADIAEIADQLKSEPYRFVVVCDDLSFESDDPSYKELKSALEGSVFARSSNVLIYATSNRRHLIEEHMSDNLAARYEGGELHEAEAVEEKISLSDRFGLWLSFYPFKQDQYLAVVRHWLDSLAKQHGAQVRWNEEVEKAALRWALGRGVRSGRTAHHFARHWVGQSLLRPSPRNPLEEL